MKTLTKLLFLIATITISSPVLADDDDGDDDRRAGRVLKVDCDKGRTIAKALRRARSGDTIQIKGTCKERVTILTHNFTLEGIDGAAIDGTGVEPPGQEFNGLLTVDGARGITIRSLTIKNSSGEGIFGVRGANMVVADAKVEGHFTGIGLSNSGAELDNVTVQDTELGIDVYTGSAVIFRGQVNISRSADVALTVLGDSAGEIRDGTLNIDNSGTGVVITADGSLSILAFATSAEGSLTSTNNQGPGIVLSNGVLLVVQTRPPPPGQEIAQMVNSSGNGGPGFFITDNGSLDAPFPFSKIVAEENPVGINAEVGATIDVGGGLTVRNNFGPGIVADDASVRVGSTDDNPSSIQGNNGAGPDVVLAFGTRATLNEAAIGPDSILCDGTVLLRGILGLTCPSP